jgi:predicted dehydrogenase
MSQILKVAVVGVGHLGKWHADKYAASADCELVAVVDTNVDNARTIAEKHGAETFTDYRDVIPLVDAITMRSAWWFQPACIIKSGASFWKREFTV